MNKFGVLVLFALLLVLLAVALVYVPVSAEDLIPPPDPYPTPGIRPVTVRMVSFTGSSEQNNFVAGVSLVGLVGFGLLMWYLRRKDMNDN